MRTVLLLGLLALSPAALAQWSSDPAANLAVADAAGGQDQPKVAPAPDGGTWISWFDGASGYDVRVQKLDAGGNEVFPHGGLLVADRSFSSTQDYGLSVDAAGNALLTFRDDRAGGTQITAALVTAAGDQPWGPTGVQLTNTSAFVAAPKIAGTSDGGAVVAWTQDESTRLQKLDADGVPQWASDVVLTPATGSYSASDLHAHGADVVLAFVHQTGPFGSPRHLLAQKFDAEGDPLWGAGHVAVFDGGSLQFGNFPTFVPDGAGGGVFSWYNTAGAGLQSYVQHVLPDGSEAFAHNGLAVSTNATRERVSPDVAYDAGTGAIYAFWTELANFQSLRGVYGQKVDAAGDRLWTDEGLAVVPVGSDDITGVRTVVNGPGAFVFWDQVPSFGQDRLYGAAASGDDGGTVDFTFDVASTPSGKSRLVAANSTAGFAVLAWKDERADDGDVYAQNVNPDGTLGGGGGAGVTADVTVLTPTVGRGDVFRARFAAQNDGAEPVTVRFVARVRLPNGNVYIERAVATRTLAPGQTAAVTGGRRVPGGAPLGEYDVEFDVVAGDDVLASDSEPFEVVAAAAAAAQANAGGVAAQPNPFASQTRLTFTLAAADEVRLAVYDVRGREVAVLVDGWTAAGTHEAVFDAAGLPSGVYVYRLQAGERMGTGRLTVLR